MRSKLLHNNLLRTLFTLILVASLILPGASSLVTDAEETGTPSQNAPYLENAFAPISFYDLLEDGALQISEQANVKKYHKSIDTTIFGGIDTLNTPDKGILVSAHPEDVTKTKISITKKFNFGQQKVDRVVINALAKRLSITQLQIFANNNPVPAGSLTLYNQSREGNWTRNEEVNVDLSAANLTGSTNITIQFTTNRSAVSAQEDLQVMLRSLEFIPQSIPVVTLDIDETKGTIIKMNSDPNHNTECYGKMSIRVPSDYEAPYGGNYTGGTYELDYIRGRGNSTWTDPKKPYKIKLDKSSNLFNMGKNKHWVLLANAMDNSLVRNRMTYWLGEQLGIAYTPQCLNVDVIMNGEYLGNYLLCEQLRVDDNRIDIDDLEKAYENAASEEDVDVSGGYWLSVKPYGDETGYGFKTNYNRTYYVNSPESVYDTPLRMRLDMTGGIGMPPFYHSITEKDTIGDTIQYDKANEYIKDYMNKVEEAICSEDLKTQDGIPYSDMLDIDSAVAYYWIQEFSMNGDFYETTSTYLYKKADVKDAQGNVIEPGKLYFGPLWDFDFVAWGSTNYEEDTFEDTCIDWPAQTQWFYNLMKDPVFAQKVKDFWFEKLKPAMEEVIRDGGLLDQYNEELQVSATNNFKKWDFKFYNEVEEPIDHPGYEYEIPHLKKWIATRLEWINNNIDHIAPKAFPLTFKNGDKVLLKTTGYTERVIPTFPEPPTKEGMVFSGWYCYIPDMDNPEISFKQVLEDNEYIWDYYLDKNGEMILYPEFSKPSQQPVIDKVEFLIDKMCGIYDSTDCNFVNFYLETYPDDDADSSQLKWKSSDESVAIVDSEGYGVYAIGPGEATITATTPTGKEYHCHFKSISKNDMPDYVLKSFLLSDYELTMKPGETKHLGITTTPEYCQFFFDDYLASPWEMESSDSDVVSIDQVGTIKALKPGKATIFVRSKTNASMSWDKCYITVKDPTPSIKVGTKFTKGNLRYSVTSCTGKNLQVKVMGKVKSAKTITIPATVSYKNKTFKVTTIKSSAFAKDKKITKVTIGKNVKKIESKAFYKCKNLKTVKISSKVLTSVGKNAWTSIKKKAKIYVPKSMKKKYKKFFKKFKLRS